MHKYLIQVNGVNGMRFPIRLLDSAQMLTGHQTVGETTRSETSITVTGLKPAHFYNVRVIAVGSSNFQAGSRVIRLRTYNRDGRPDLGGRVPSSLATDEASPVTATDSSDDSAAVKCHGVAIEAAAMPDGISALVRDSASHVGSRRNTVARKHSPSNASERPSLHTATEDVPEGSMQELTGRFETIRKETEDMIAQTAKDHEDSKVQTAGLSKERDEKRQLLREKEEASEKLKKEVHASERLNRQAQTRKTQKEKVLRAMQAERAKMLEDMKKWEKGIQEMRAERELWEKEKKEVAEETEKKADEMRAVARRRQTSLTAMEEEIRVKGLQIKEMEEERKKFPGVEDDEESKALEAADKLKDQQWELKERDLMARYNASSIHLRTMESDLHKAQVYFQQLSARQTNPLMYHGNSSAVDFSLDATGQQQRPKQRRNRQRKSRTNTLTSATALNAPGSGAGYPIDQAQGQVQSTYPHANPYAVMGTSTSQNFAPGPYFDMSANATATSPDHTGLTDAEIKAFTAGAPLSPTATSLLPSNIFQDDDPPEQPLRGFGPALNNFPSLNATNPRPSMYENDPKYSPDSSSRSASLIGSPMASQHNLPLLQPGHRESYGEADRHLLASRHSTGGAFGVIGSPSSDYVVPARNQGKQSQMEGTPESATRRFGDLFSFSGLPGTKARSKTIQSDGFALGSLKPHSSSSPKAGDEYHLAATAAKNRRTSFTTGWESKIPFLNRGSVEGNGPAPARNSANPIQPTSTTRRRGFNMFGTSIDDPNAIPADRSPGSPRPASIASSDLPRPSTDSAPFGWAPSLDGGVGNGRSPLATNWSLNTPSNPTQLWASSRPGSRRPSIQQPLGGSGLGGGGILSDDDEFLPGGVFDSPPPAGVGVIGTRPVSRMSTLSGGASLAGTPSLGSASLKSASLRSAGWGSAKKDLNPTAPTFMAKFSFNKGDLEKREKKSRNRKGKSKAKYDPDSPIKADSINEDQDDSSFFSGGRHSRDIASRDGHSIKTLNSVAESYDSLENALSNSFSDNGLHSQKSTELPSSSMGSAARSENSFQKLLRKGSSSKFSIASFRGKEMFGAKKGSDKDSGVDEGSMEDISMKADVTSSPAIGTVREEKGEGKDIKDGKDTKEKTGTPREGRMSVNWGRFNISKKKEKGRVSEELERPEAKGEWEGSGDEGRSPVRK